MNRVNEFGIPLHHRSKAEVPFTEWAADLPDKIREDFPADLRKAHRSGTYLPPGQRGWQALTSLPQGRRRQALRL